MFGSGAALVLDEFALVFRLQDVYWSDEGRASIDAVIIALTVGVLVLLHVVPFDEDTSQDAGRWTVMVALSIHFALVVVTLLKGKIWTGLIGIFVVFVALFGASGSPSPARPGRGASTRPGATASPAPRSASAATTHAGLRAPSAFST